MPGFFIVLYILFAAYFLAVAAYYLIHGFIGLAEDRKRLREHDAEHYQLLFQSRFTVPVTIIIPLHNEEVWGGEAVQSALNLEYPEFELIVVDDGSTDNTFEALNRILELRFDPTPYHDQFRSGKILGLYSSGKYPRARVLKKESGFKKAGALNAALNLARYRYVCTIDGDTVLEPDALLKVMAHVQKDPENIVGAGSYFGLANGFEIEDGRILEKSFSWDPLIAYQNLEYARSFIGSRIAWSRWNATPIVSGGFAVWRRDVLLLLGGFDPRYSSEDLEFTFRVHDFMVGEGRRDYKILMLPYYVGWTEGPGDIRSLIKQRNRWHRVTLEAVWRYRHMFFNPKFGSLGMVVFPYFVFYEALGVFFEVSSLLITVLGFFSGQLSWRFFTGFFLFMILCLAASSLIPLYALNRDQKMFRAGQMSYLIALSFVELLAYRWIQALAKLQGTWHFFRGVKTMDRVRRVRVRRF